MLLGVTNIIAKRRLLVLFITLLSYTPYCVAHANENSQIEASMLVSTNFDENVMGITPGGSSASLTFDLHSKGLFFNASGSLFEKDEISKVEFEAGYSYLFEQFHVAVGGSLFDTNLFEGDFSLVSLIVEIEGRQEILGLIPELHFSKSVNKSSVDYLNLRLGKEIYEGRFLINPYAEFVMGSIYSDSFKSNNILLGVDVVTPIGEELYLSPHMALNFPLGSVKEFDDEANTSVEFGIAIRKDF